MKNFLLSLLAVTLFFACNDGDQVEEFGNHAPVANAGPDHQVGYPADAVTIYGHGTDVDNDSLSYKWYDQDSTVLSLDSTLTLTNLPVGDHYYGLEVSDNSTFTRDTVMVRVTQ